MDRIIAVKWKVKVKEIELQQGLLESLKIEAWSYFLLTYTVLTVFLNKLCQMHVTSPSRDFSVYHSGHL